MIFIKIFDHNTEYTDEEWMQFAHEAFKIPDGEARKKLEAFVNFTIGDPEPKGKDPKYWKDLYDKITKEESLIASGFTPVITTKLSGTVPFSYETLKKATDEYLTTIKIPGLDKIRWRWRSRESVKTSRWNRNHTKQAEFYYFWNIECRNAKMYIPLEEQYNTKSGFLEIPVPHLELRFPLPRNES